MTQPWPSHLVPPSPHTLAEEAVEKWGAHGEKAEYGKSFKDTVQTEPVRGWVSGRLGGLGCCQQPGADSAGQWEAWEGLERCQQPGSQPATS